MELNPIQPPIEQLMQQAGQLLGAGKLADAEQLLRQILQHDPNHADATHALGVIASLAGNPQAALQLVARANQLAPAVAEYAINLGDLFITANQPQQAELELKRALTLKPNHPHALMKLGMAVEAQNRIGEAENLYRRAIASAPNFAEAHCNLGDALLKQDRFADAIRQYDQAISLKPALAPAWANRGVARDKLGQRNEALADLRQALRIDPNLHSAIIYAGRVCYSLKSADEALRYFSLAAEKFSQSGEAQSGIGMTQLLLGDYDAAILACRRAIELFPELNDPYGNLALALSRRGEHAQALNAFDRAVALRPDRPIIRANRALVLLRLGDFEQGLREYELRLQTPDFQEIPRINSPRWDGRAELAGKTILLQFEQGLGDTIQFIRYAPLLSAHGAKVIVQAQEELHRLLRGVSGIQRIISRNEPTPPSDFHLPMLSLPFAMGTTLQSIPADIPYLGVDPALKQKWSDRLAPHARPRVGLCWQGKAEHVLDRDRSIPADLLAPLTHVEGVQYFSLQFSPHASKVPDALKLIDFTAEASDFSESAALIANLDLVITVDTSITHLAGAIGQTVWTLLQFSPDFRWMLDREDSPWYPTMRLFRQTRFRDWPTVIDRVAAELGAQFAK
jgi:tetratricopeptide (TPR) repeat protein